MKSPPLVILMLLLIFRFPSVSQSVVPSDYLEKVLHHSFSKLHCAPEEHPVLLSEPRWNSNGQREEMAQIMFENFRSPAIHISMQAVLALHASGHTTGTVLDSGDRSTLVVPIYEGHALRHAVRGVDAAGCDATDFLHKILNGETDERFSLDTISDIKEKLCYVALDFDQEMQTTYDRSWRVDPCSLSRLQKRFSLTGTFFSSLPKELLSHVYNFASSKLASSTTKFYELLLPADARIIALENQLFRCAEIFFQPDFLGMESGGFHETIYSSIMKCDVEIRKELFRNILLSGGSTMFPGMAERIHRELIPLAPDSYASLLHVIAPADRKLSAWIGGSKLASLSTFANMCVSKQEYEEFGSAIIQRKFF